MFTLCLFVLLKSYARVPVSTALREVDASELPQSSGVMKRSVITIIHCEIPRHQFP